MNMRQIRRNYRKCKQTFNGKKNPTIQPTEVFGQDKRGSDRSYIIKEINC